MVLLNLYKMIKIKNNKVVGILGGMGPRATVSFVETMIDLTPAKKDWEHIPIVIDNNPQIPSRTRCYLFNEESPVPHMVNGCQKLAAWPVDIIAIPCNSACYFLPQVQSEIATPIVNIMEVAVDRLMHEYSDVKKCAVIGGRITYTEKTYAPFLEKNGVSYVHHDEMLQKRVEEVIENIKVNADSKKAHEDYVGIVSELQVAHNVDAVILGCTEFGLIESERNRQGESNIIPIVDSSRALALFLVDFATKEDE